LTDSSSTGLPQKRDNQSFKEIESMITIDELNKLNKARRMSRYWQKSLGYSDDSLDIVIGSLELTFRKTNNPKYVWRAIGHINQREISYYPKWIRDYLDKCAKQIAECKPVAGGQSDVVAALGFSSLRQLNEEDSFKIERAYDEMCYLVSCNKTIEKAAILVEIMINDDGLKPKQRGYLGNWKLEKIYREFMKKSGPSTAVADYLEEKEIMEREYEEAVEKGYEKKFLTYCEEEAAGKL